ncbi:Putative RNA 2'-phosphotransferase [Durusdinium trenchii]
MSRKKGAPHPLSPRTPSSPSRRPKPHLQDELEDLRTRLGGGEEEAEDKEAIAKKVLKLLIHAFSNNASKALRRRAENLKPRSVAQALAAVIAFDVKLLKDHWEVLPELFKPVSLDAAAAGHLWQVMSGAHPVVRLAFLESVVVQEVQMEGPASAVAKWQRAGVELSAVARVLISQRRMSITFGSAMQKSSEVAACLDFVSREEEARRQFETL